MSEDSEIKSLKESVSNLQKSVSELLGKNTNAKLFGKSLNIIGSSSSNLILKTSGGVKIQWGRKYIDLIKDGKINADTSSFLYLQDDVGSDDGIYVSTDGSTITLVVDGTQIALTGESSTVYVSFMAEQETDSEMKHTALTNIGFIYENLTDVGSTALLNGIIYVENTLKLYTVVNGTLAEYTAEFPNPYTELFVIAKEDSSIGALVIEGTGKENSLRFDSMYIYSDGEDFYFDSDGDIYFRIDDDTILKLTDDGIVTDSITSEGATSSKGFRLYYKNGESTLEVDNLIVRNGIDTDSEKIYPEYYYYENNIIVDAEMAESDEEEEEETESDEEEEEETESDEEETDDYTGEEIIEMFSDSAYDLTLRYPCNYKVGDILYIFFQVNDEDSEYDNSYKMIKLPVLVTALEFEEEDDTNNYGITVQVLTDLIDNYEDFSDLDIEFFEDYLTGSIIFKVGDADTTILVPKISQVGFEIQENTISTTDSVTALESEINTRIGNLEDLSLQVKEDGETIDLEDNTGIYTNNFVALKAQYSSDYDLPEDDSSTKFASTEWVRNVVLMPGYYSSVTANSSETTPVDPTYVGTTTDNFEGVSEEVPYLWYTNDGDTWVLVEKYIEPDENYYYIASTGVGYTVINSETLEVPDEFLAIVVDDETEYYTHYITSNNELRRDFEDDVTESNSSSLYFTAGEDDYMDKLSLLLDNTEAGQVPSLDGFYYIWRISKDVVDSGNIEYSDIELISSTGAASEDITVAIAVSTAGIINTRDVGKKVWVTVDNGKIIEFLSTDTNETYGDSIDNWTDTTWFIRWIMNVMYIFYVNNKGYYSETFNRFIISSMDSFTIHGGLGGSITVSCYANKSPSYDTEYMYAPLVLISAHLTYYKINVDLFLRAAVGAIDTTLGQASTSYSVGSTAQYYNGFPTIMSIDNSTIKVTCMDFNTSSNNKTYYICYNDYDYKEADSYEPTIVEISQSASIS